MAFFPITTSHFDKQFSKLSRKNAVFKAQAAKKIKGIALNPEIVRGALVSGIGSF